MTGQADGAVTFCLQVSDLAAVQRVLMTVVGRRHALLHFAAQEAGSGRWDVTLRCPVGADEQRLLHARLARPPGVITVGVAGRPAGATG